MLNLWTCLNSYKFSVLHSDVFWAYSLLEVKDWIVWWYPKSPHGCSWGSNSNNIWRSLHLGINRFLLLSICRLFHLVFTWNRHRKCVTRTFLGRYFWAPIPLKQHQNTSGCSTGLSKINASLLKQVN